MPDARPPCLHSWAVAYPMVGDRVLPPELVCTRGRACPRVPIGEAWERLDRIVGDVAVIEGDSVADALRAKITAAWVLWRAASKAST